MKEYEKDALLRLIEGGRYISVLPDSPEARYFVQTNNLDVRILPPKEIGQIVVGTHKKIRDVISIEDINEVGFPEYINELKNLYAKISDELVVDAFILLQNLFIENNYQFPEIDIIYGLLFRFKVCDIRYYVQTRDQGIEKHSLEAIIDEHIGDRVRNIEEQQVYCYECSKKILGIK